MMIDVVIVVDAVAVVVVVVAFANAVYVELPIFWERRTQQEAHELGHNHRHRKTEC